MAPFKNIFRLWRLIRTVFFFFMFVLFFLLTALIHFLLTLIDRTGEWPHRFARLWGKWTLFWSGVDVRVKGLEHVCKNGPQVFMANHQSHYDIPVLMGYLPVRFSWTAKKELFRIPVFGFTLKRANYIQVDRQNHAKAMASMELAAQQIRGGISVMVFPEGTRSSNGSLLPFKKGGVLLALKAGVPIIPIGISGSREILPRGSLCPKPGTIRMVIGPPIDSRNYSLEQRNDLLICVRKAIEACLENARSDETLKI